jgi:hypothetical protein
MSPPRDASRGSGLHGSLLLRGKPGARNLANPIRIQTCYRTGRAAHRRPRSGSFHPRDFCRAHRKKPARFPSGASRNTVPALAADATPYRSSEFFRFFARSLSDFRVFQPAASFNRVWQSSQWLIYSPRSSNRKSPFPSTRVQSSLLEKSTRPGSSVVERSPEKAGVGGSIPSLATTFQRTCTIRSAKSNPHSTHIRPQIYETAHSTGVPAFIDAVSSSSTMCVCARRL